VLRASNRRRVRVGVRVRTAVTRPDTITTHPTRAARPHPERRDTDGSPDARWRRARARYRACGESASARGSNGKGLTGKERRRAIESPLSPLSPRRRDRCSGFFLIDGGTSLLYRLRSLLERIHLGADLLESVISTKRIVVLLFSSFCFPVNENGLKWTEMDSFCSCQIQILIFLIHFYPISFRIFFKFILIHMKG